MKRLIPAVTLTVTAIALSGCAGKSAPDASTPPSPSPVVTSPAPSLVESPTAAPSPTAPTVDQTIRITYAGGRVTGSGGVVSVKKNSTVALVVTSDTADEIHLHGYDKSVDVEKGGTVTLTFKATLTGKWEVELEKLKRRLVFLQVQ
ncbi:MAG: hypothetical protein QOE05_163 [Actinomycetota bacterium]|jgi:copper(I)-binding protein|nr:hypothetical protein [Actinomycetota bacterium]